MDIEDLRKFIVIAECNNLQQASAKLNVTAGALSKVIKRLENKLNTEVFDRVGRGLEINPNGSKFLYYAKNLVHETDQAVSEFAGESKLTPVTITGPSVLLQHWLPTLVDKLTNGQFTFSINAQWEGEAYKQLNSGAAHLALTTDLALAESQSSGLKSIKLGKTIFKVVASKQHTIFKRHANGRVSNLELAEYSFACPNVSPFCGIKRGIGSDGWRDDKVSRSIRYRCNDFSTLIALVQSGHALAYVPDFIAEQYQLEIIDVTDCDFVCEENIQLVYKPSVASGWLNQLVSQIANEVING